MYSKLQLAEKYVRYYLTASNGKGHGIHSPFVFELITKVLNDNRTYYCYQTIEALREQLKHDTAILTIEDFGAGSSVNLTKERKISSISKSALKSKKLAQLLFRIVNYLEPKTIFELGTSLGITTSYLASGNLNAKLITMEGSPAIAKIAKRNFDLLQLKNIILFEGNFDETLESAINSQPSTIDFAFIDGNHRKVPTIKYFGQLLTKANEQSVFIFDDIHWSKEMEEAWLVIKLNNAVTLTIDLFFIGIVFFRKEIKEKQHFTIRF